LLRCPLCRNHLEYTAEELHCVEASCGASFPIINGVPILLNERNSLFTIESFRSTPEPRREHSALTGIMDRVYGMLPPIDKSRQQRNYMRFVQELGSRSAPSRVLVIGGGVLGEGMEILINNPMIEFVETDVYIGPRTRMICDGHDIPFADEAFDGLIIQAVLEHVLDPHRCVAEIHRVLKPGGVVYAETPFMQQMHGAPFDFTRFTYLGHRRLFRNFSEIDSGAICGPGMALAWSFEYFLLSLTGSRILRKILRHFARIISFPLVYIDPFLLSRPGTIDAASGFYFLGARADTPLPDRELITLHQGVR
jgi:SAM-dependent methyltransferase